MGLNIGIIIFLIKELIKYFTWPSNNNPINFGAFNIYPEANSLITSGYSYADTVANNQLDPNDIKTPGP